MTGIPATLEALRVPVDSLEPYGRNPRRGDVDRIAESLQVNGQFRPIVVNRRDRQVLAGNHTLLAARKLGWSEVAATFVDVDDEQAARIVLADNATADAATYDDRALADLMADLPGLEGTGWDRSGVDELMGRVASLSPGRDTAPIDPPKEPVARPGDLFVLGDHRLLCGDSTSREDVERLLDGTLADLVYTDPPYGISYESSKLGGIRGDDLRGDQLEALVADALGLAVAFKHRGAGVYVWCSWRTYPEFVSALKKAGLKPGACIVWRKGRVGPGSSHYRPEHEFCLLCRPELPGDHELCVYCKGDEWNGGRGESDVWEVSRDTGYLHPTQKPIELAERAMSNSTEFGWTVLDLFGGSGSTLIAAENLGRRSCVMELDPAYVDVIVDRWERHTGKKAGREEVMDAAA